MTPSLISLLNDSNPFIPNLIRQAFGRNANRIEVDILAGVVDQISHRTENSGRAERWRYSGSEGLSLCFSTSSPTIPDLWSTTEESPDQSAHLPHPQCTLSFRITPKRPSFLGQKVFYDNIAAVRTLDLPLANTVFLNGRTSTLHAQRWAVNPNPGSEAWLSRERHKLLDRQTILLFPSTNITHTPHMEMPAYSPLTPPRVIESSMGNIIRNFRATKSDINYPTPIPASADIEKTLPNWTCDPKAHLEVWAQVIPHERWSGLPQLLGGSSDVDQGYRFHKVLSGGGGWGNKLGLISLDPETSFGSTKEQVVFGDGEDPEAEQRRALGEVVRPGDVVRFLAFKHIPASNSNRSPKQSDLVGTSVRIGSIPSQRYESLQQPVPQSGEADDSGYFVDCGHFGALSETGLSMHVQVSTEEGNQPLETVVQTKLPPCTSFTWSRIVAVPKQPKGEEATKPLINKKPKVPASPMAPDNATHKQQSSSETVHAEPKWKETEDPPVEKTWEKPMSASNEGVKVRRVQGMAPSRNPISVKLLSERREGGAVSKGVEQAKTSLAQAAAAKNIIIRHQKSGPVFRMLKITV